MSSTDSEATAARPARSRALIALFGVAMFFLGVGIGGLALPRLLALNPERTPQASVVAQAPRATTTATGAATLVAIATPPTATTAPPTATTPPPTTTVVPTATVPPPTTTPLPPTATVTATTVPTPTNPASAIFAPDPSATPSSAGTEPTAAASTPTSSAATATATATAAATPTVGVTATPTSVPTSTPTTEAFAATDRIFTELPVNFRAGPGTNYTAQTALPPGTLLAATGETATVDGVVWRQFSLANGTIGWVRAMDVTAVR